jgi:hypothetical protein
LNKGKPSAERAVTKFHQQLDAEQYHDIYAAAPQGFRDGGPEDRCARFLQVVHHKLGEVRESNQTGFFFNINTEGTWIKLNYRTEFRNGMADEQFIWKVSGDQALLYRYDINSTELVTMDGPASERDADARAVKSPDTSRR